MLRVMAVVVVFLWLLGLVVPFTGLAPAWWFVVPAVTLSALWWVCFMVRFGKGVGDEQQKS